MAASTVALCNLKGGVGKTSTTFHLAGTLAKDGRRVLLLDVDPQASLTQGVLRTRRDEVPPPGGDHRRPLRRRPGSRPRRVDPADRLRGASRSSRGPAT